MGNKRIKYIDMAKGMGIVLVLLGHTYNLPNSIYSVIYSFHMPLFFILSGFVYNIQKHLSYSLEKYITMLFKRYIVYYFFFILINGIVECLWMIYQQKYIAEIGLAIVRWIMSSIYCYAYIDFMPNCSPVWFLWCLFWAELIVWMVYKYLPQKRLCFVLTFGISVLLSRLIDIQLPLEIAPAFMAASYIFVGIEMHKMNVVEYFIKKRVLLFIILVIGLYAAFLNGNSVNMAENEYGNILLFLISSIMLSLYLICCCAILDKKIKGRFWDFLGKNTIVLIGCNYLLRKLSVEIYYLIPILKESQINWQWNFIITLILSIVLCFLWNKIKKCLNPVTSV